MNLKGNTVLSLFSGCGGFDLGLERSGFKTVFQCEIDKYAKGVLLKNWPNVPKWDDVRTLSAKEILKHESKIDIVAWGSPCQDMSVSGNRAGLGGDKSSLFYEGIRIINELREETNGRYPRISIWENVAGALISNSGLDFKSVVCEMAKSGSSVQEYAVLDASLFGVPQVRNRVFLVSVFDSDIARNCPETILPLDEIYERNNTKTPTVKEDILSFYRVHGKYSTPRRNISPPLLTVSSVCVASPSIRPRALTAIEHERLMGWPDNWTDLNNEVSFQQRIRMCGNGVVAPVATWVGNKLNACL
jgi:DNA-cytosine methyltransferase